MAAVVRGVVHGRTIELTGDPGIADGATVEVTVRAVADPDPRVAAILRTAGAMADDPEFDAAMEEIRRDRRSAQYRELAE